LRLKLKSSQFFSTHLAIWSGKFLGLKFLPAQPEVFNSFFLSGEEVFVVRLRCYEKPVWGFNFWNWLMKFRANKKFEGEKKKFEKSLWQYQNILPFSPLLSFENVFLKIQQKKFSKGTRNFSWQKQERKFTINKKCFSMSSN